MTPEELEKLPKPIERTMSRLELAVMAEVVDRIRQAGEITPVVDHLLNRMYALGTGKLKLKALIREALSDADKTVDQIYRTAVSTDYIRNKALYESVGKEYLPYEDNEWLQQLVEASRRQTKDDLRTFENLTKTTGFNVIVGGRRVFSPLSEYFEQSLDRSLFSIASGMQTYSQAVGAVIDEMTRSGLRVVDYASGKSDRIEVAARRAVMTGVAQMTDKVNEKNAEELHTDYWEVDYHPGARNKGVGIINHQSWQGKCYSSAEMVSVCGLGDILGFAGVNCYHVRFPFIPGVSKRKYTDEWLAEQNKKENTPREYRGKEYTLYDALQYQRKLERTIRKQKQDIALLERAGADEEDIIAAKCRLRLTNQNYVDFSKAMGIRQQLERLRMPKEKIENPVKTGSIKTLSENESSDVLEYKKLGNLKHLQLLEKTFGKMQTDELIITNERIKHIKIRHPEDYELFLQYGERIATDPDLIVRDVKNAGTAFAIKHLPDTNLNVILRLALETDNIGLKNSIMTFYRIRERNLKKLVEKNELIYKKE